MKVAVIIFPANHRPWRARWALSAEATLSKRRYTKPTLCLLGKKGSRVRNTENGRSEKPALSLLTYLRRCDWWRQIWSTLRARPPWCLDRSPAQSAQKFYNHFNYKNIEGDIRKNNQNFFFWKIITSTLGSNMFFSRRHSLGGPMGSTGAAGLTAPAPSMGAAGKVVATVGISGLATLRQGKRWRSTMDS